MVTVEAEADDVEARLAAGGLTCPLCSGVLTGWGHARARTLRGSRAGVRLRPRRTRCRGCGVTHVLLPVVALLRRADLAVVIGAALAVKAAGAGARPIAAGLGRPLETVRGWLRRFGARLEPVRAVFTRWLVALDADPPLPGPAGGEWADALAAIIGAADALGRRFGMRTAPHWQVAVVISAGRLLAPGWPPGEINTSRP